METTENAEDTERTARCGPKLIHEELTGKVRQVAFDVHRYLGNGFVEKVYENALAHRLRKAGYEVSTQAELSVQDEDGVVVGRFVADMVIEGIVLVEVKAVARPSPEHHAQVLNYLKATGLRVGMLVNFGQPRLQVKRFVL